MSHASRNIPFIYGGDEYIFRADYTQKTPTGKIVNSGSFETPPSGTVPPGQTCVLIELPITQAAFDAGAPQLRFQYELLNFDHAPHLRRILLRDDTSEKVSGYLKRGERLPNREFVCRIVEPRYQSSAEAFQDPSKTTVYERLELLIQTIKGIQELQRGIGSASRETLSAIAHRDIKLGNILIQPGKGVFTAVLIDLASLKIDVSNGTYTSQPMSASNTTPEGLGVGGEITEKTDVFALGGMVGELFGTCNPIQRWVEIVGNQDKERLREKYRNAKEYYGDWNGSSSWIVDELNGGRLNPIFSWQLKETGIAGFESSSTAMFFGTTSRLKETGIAGFESSLNRLLRDATQVSPERRPSLDELKTRLRKLQDQCGESRTFSNHSLYIPDLSSATLPVCLFDISQQGYIDRYVSSVKAYLPGTDFAVGVYRRKATPADRNSAAINPVLCEGADNLSEFLEDAWRVLNGGSSGGESALWDALNKILDVFRSPVPYFSEREWDALSLWIFTPRLPSSIGERRYAEILDRIRRDLSPRSVKAVICEAYGAGTVKEFSECLRSQPPKESGFYVNGRNGPIYL